MCTNCALDKKALRLSVIHVGEVCSFADYFIICTGASDRHVAAISESVQSAMKVAGFPPIGVEGKGFNNWVLLDYGDVVVHVFLEEKRELYDLEGLWSFAPTMQVADEIYHIPQISFTPRRIRKEHR
ncbi:MAG: ribosome silencing factor [Deltaproteobacteria bacterium]|nr:ribosome silencing factor [Deltaproteobacteria bacterium]